MGTKGDCLGDGSAASQEPLCHSLLQDEELLGHVQSAILQVQGDCEKLNVTTSNLIEDHRQKQKDIEVSSHRAPGVGVGLINPAHACHSALLTSLSLFCGSPGAVPGNRETG